MTNRQTHRTVQPARHDVLGGSENSSSIRFDGDVVAVLSNGAKDVDFVRNLWSEILAVCSETGCHRILGSSNSSRPLNHVEAIEIVDLFEDLGIDKRFRIAWVEKNPKAVPIYETAEIVLRLRSVPVRLFGDLDDARRWLLRS